MAYQGSTEAGTAVADAIFGNQSQRQIVGDLAIRRGRPGWRLPDRRSVAVTPGDIDGTAAPRVEPGAYRVQVGSMMSDFTVS